MSTESSSSAEDALLLRKQIKSTRTFLIIVAVVTLISASLLLPNLPDNATMIEIIMIVVISGIYFFLALWTKKRPYTAVVAGLVLLLVTVLVDIIWNPLGPTTRWQSKIISLIMLFMAFSDAKDAQRKMKAPAQKRP